MTYLGYLFSLNLLSYPDWLLYEMGGTWHGIFPIFNEWFLWIYIFMMIGFNLPTLFPVACFLVPSSGNCNCSLTCQKPYKVVVWYGVDCTGKHFFNCLVAGSYCNMLLRVHLYHRWKWNLFSYNTILEHAFRYSRVTRGLENYLGFSNYNSIHSYWCSNQFNLLYFLLICCLEFVYSQVHS